MALGSHLLFCFIPCSLFRAWLGTRTREATLPSPPCPPCSSIPSESLHSVPLFLSLKMTLRPCKGRTPPGPHLRPVTGLSSHTGCHCRGSLGRFDSLGTNTFTEAAWALPHTPWAALLCAMGTAAHSMGSTGALPPLWEHTGTNPAHHTRVKH